MVNDNYRLSKLETYVALPGDPLDDTRTTLRDRTRKIWNPEIQENIIAGEGPKGKLSYLGAPLFKVKWAHQPNDRTQIEGSRSSTL